MSDADYAWWSPGQVFLFSQVGEDEALDSVRRRALRVD
jgi:hypothetical protein